MSLAGGRSRTVACDPPLDGALAAVAEPVDRRLPALVSWGGKDKR